LLRILEKEKIVARVAAGELGLMDAVEQIRTLYDGEPTFLRGMRLKLPHASDTELCALNVISCVRAQLWNRPHEQAAQLERLQAEWEWFKESNQSAM
jgi:hypothetical protein